jgi:TrmH family RNA methyltransferase
MSTNNLPHFSRGDTRGEMDTATKKKAGRDEEQGESRLLEKITRSVRILLVRPMYAGNVGSVARVMKNLGFQRLGIVSDQDPRKEPEAFWMAHGAEDVLEAATLYPDIEEALRPLGMIIGTTSRRGSRWREAIDPEGLVETLAAGWDWQPTAILFGPEDRGLPVRELARCRYVLRIPTREDCPSMNLSHAVGLVCYVLARGPVTGLKATGPRSASPAAMRRFTEEAEGFLEETGFLTGDSARDQSTLRRLERLLLRASPTRAEMALLWALLRHVERRE